MDSWRQDVERFEALERRRIPATPLLGKDLRPMGVRDDAGSDRAALHPRQDTGRHAESAYLRIGTGRRVRNWARIWLRRVYNSWRLEVKSGPWASI
jgi:hypothetical protein